MFYNLSMKLPLNSTPQTPVESAALSAPQLVERVGKLEHEVLNLRRQVAWFQRQIFGQKSEKCVLTLDPLQGTLGVDFGAVAGTALAAKKTVVAGHERKTEPASSIDEPTLFFDEKKVPVEVIAVPNCDAEGLTPDQYDSTR